MVRVTVEIVPFGRESAKRVLGTLNIVNDGTGSSILGNYFYTFFSSAGKQLGKGEVFGFPRERSRVWELLYSVLDVAKDTEELPPARVPYRDG